VRMSDLADNLLLTPSGLTRMMARLEERGLVQRTRGTTDARETYATLTKRGAEVLAKAAPLHNEELKAHFLHALTPDECATLAALLGKVAAEPVACPRHAPA
jgi:DNA-binding MarR family transcriptional regulator